MKIVADLQVHSHYARAVSQSMIPATISEWALKKGIGLVATGDWTHPLWFRELQMNLEEAGQGVYRLRSTDHRQKAVDSSQKSVVELYFLLSTEISSIYSQGGRVRRVHTLIFSPNFEVCEKINRKLSSHGANLFSDGRPIVGLSAKAIAEIVLAIDPRCLIIPAHAYTPHFSIFGSESGFDSIEECFGDLAPNIHAIETGLSSDPAMNWRIKELDSRSIVSFSDAHSPAKLGREATVFEMSEINYGAVRQAIIAGPAGRHLHLVPPANKHGAPAMEAHRRPSPACKIAYTIEFYPEEGKYHYTGHRSCNVVYSPEDEKRAGKVCPVCARPLTVGVESRVEYLAAKTENPRFKVDDFGVRWVHHPTEERPPYVMLVPLMEILAEAYGVGVGSQRVINNYELIINNLGSEFKILLETELGEIKRVAGERVAEAISKVRSGNISIEPGYDGVFGKVKIFGEGEKEKEATSQASLF